MARHPIEQHAEPGVVAGIDKGAEIVGRAEAAGRREQRDRLIAPRAVERVLGDRHELEMGEAHVARHRARARRRARDRSDSAPSSPACGATSRDGLRRSRSARRGRCAPALGHPRRRRARHGARVGARPRRCRAAARRVGMGIGLQRQQLAVGADDLVFVKMPRAAARGRRISQMPVAPRSRIGHAPAVPVVELADHADRRALGAHTAKATPVRTLVHGRMRAELRASSRYDCLRPRRCTSRSPKHRREAIDVVEFARDAAVPRRAAGSESERLAGRACRRQKSPSGMDARSLRPPRARSRCRRRQIRRAPGRNARTHELPPRSCACRERRTDRRGAPRGSPRSRECGVGTAVSAT